MRALTGVVIVLFGLMSGTAEAHGGRDRGSWSGGSAIIVPPGSTVIIVPRPHPVPPPAVGFVDPWQPSWRHRPPPVFVPPVRGWPHPGPGFSSRFDTPRFDTPRFDGPQFHGGWSSRHRW